MAKLHVIVLSLGTDGDVYPFIAVGVALAARGHRVTLLANGSYEQLARELGFSFRPLITREEADQVLAHPAFWDQSSPLNLVRSVRLVSGWGRQFIERHYSLARSVLEPGSVLVASPAVIAARLLHDKMKLPLVSLVHTPWMIPSISLPPLMPAGLSLPSWAPRVLGKLYFRMIDGAGALTVGRDVNRFRLGLGLDPVQRIFRWWFSPQGIVGLFPDWYAPPQPDWPKVYLAGFPVFDGCGARELGKDLREFCEEGPAPVAFTFGTGLRQVRHLFETGLEVCRRLNLKGIFLTKFQEELSTSLPPFVRAVDFTPFHLLFPRCTAVVHHGGIGTTARALAAGAPQVILPIAFDQLDNAARVKRLGAGDWLSSKGIQGARLAAVLNGVMQDGTRQRCRLLAERLAGQNAQDTAAEWIEARFSEVNVR